MMFLILLILVGSSDPVCLIAVDQRDRITEIQVESVLERHHIRYSADGMFGFGKMAIYTHCSALEAAKILAVEAPAKKFSMHITEERRQFTDMGPWSIGKSLAELDKDLPSLKLRSALSKLSPPLSPSLHLKYRIRNYTGLDQKTHVGLEVRLSGEMDAKTYQFL